MMYTTDTTDFVDSPMTGHWLNLNRPDLQATTGSAIVFVSSENDIWKNKYTRIIKNPKQWYGKAWSVMYVYFQLNWVPQTDR